MPPDRPPPALPAAIRELVAGRPEGARLFLSAAAAADPSNAAVQHDLGLACLETGDPARAAEAFRRAAILSPDDAVVHFRLGLALERLGEARAAVVAFDRATALRPSMAEAWFRAGALVFTLGHREEAIGCFRRAASTGRGGIFGRLGRARALLAEGRDAEAEPVLRLILGREPDNAMAQDLLGHVLADAGRFEEAEDRFARAVDASPRMAGSHYDLLRCRRQTEADLVRLPGMRRAAADPDLPAEQRIRVHLAMGKLHDDLEAPEAAMREFDAADALRAASSPFDAERFERRIESLIARFPGGPPDRPPPPVPPGGPTPILILGLPRSGTTLLERILSAHDGIGAAGELDFWNAHAPALLDGATAETGRPGAAATAYRSLLRRSGPRASHVTDKMPFNFLWAGAIHAALPDAILLHCRRRPIASALSIHQTFFSPRLAFPTGGEALVRYVRAYLRLSAHWRATLPPDRFVELDYETLTAEPEAATRRVLEACGLGWEAACAHPERNPDRIRTPSRWQSRQPIHRRAAERWRRYESCLGPLAALIRAGHAA